MLKTKHAIAAGAIGLGLLAGNIAYAASLTTAQVSSILSLLSSFGADSATIANVQAALTGVGTPTPVVVPVLKIGSKGAAVVALQKELIAQGYDIPLITKGGVAYGYYGSQTQTAVDARSKAGSITPVYSGLRVSLSASGSGSSSVLVQGQGIADLGDFVFTNSSGSSVSIKSLVFRRIGVSNDSTINNVYLYNGVSRITDSASVSSGQFSFSDPTAIFTIPAGQSYTVSVRADIANGTSGQQIGVSLLSVNSSSALDSSVVFPISGGYQTISAADLASVTFSSNSPSSASISPQTSYVVWQNTLNVSVNNVKLNSIKFTNLGSIDSSSVRNIRLFVDGNQVSSGILASDRTVTFDLSSNPLSLSTQGHTIKVLADIVGGSSRTIKFSIQRSSDVMLVDAQLNQPIVPNVTSAGTLITINSVSETSGISVSVDPSSPNQDVAKDAVNVKLASFDFLSSGEDVKVESLDVYSNVALQNGKVFVNGLQVGSTKTIQTSATTFNLGSSFILSAGVTTVVDVYADTKNITVPIMVTLGAGASNAQGQSSLNSTSVPVVDVAAYSVNVSPSSIGISKYSGYGDQTVTTGANVKLGSFTLFTGSTEGVNVNTIIVSLSAANAATITNLTLKSGANMLGSVVTSPSTSNMFSLNLDVPASSSKVIDIYANILTSANNGSIQTGVTASGSGDLTGTNTSSGSVVNLQTVSIGQGSLVVAMGAGAPVSANILAGANNVGVSQFTFTSRNSSYTVQSLDITVPGGSINDIANVVLSYKDKNGNVQTSSQILIGSVAKFTGLTFYVPTNSSANLNVLINTSTIASSAVSGDAISANLSASDFRAIDGSGTSLTSISGVSGSNSFYVRESLPVLSVIALDNATLTAGTNRAIARFNVSADNAGDISWGKIVFSVGKSVDVVINNFALYKGSSLVAGTFVTTTSSITFVPTSEQQIAAGSSSAYELRSTISNLVTGYNYVDISIGNPSISSVTDTYANVAATNASFVWSDRSSKDVVHSLTTSDWANDYLVAGLSLDLATPSVKI